MIPLVFALVPAFAEVQWPPPTAEIPRTLFTESSFDWMKESLRVSLGSISNTGLLIIGTTASFGLIAVIFKGLFLKKLRLAQGVSNAEFRREVKAEDRKRNLDSIVEDRVGDMEVSLLAKNRFRHRHPHADVDEAIYRREVSYQANQELGRRHSGFWKSKTRK